MKYIATLICLLLASFSAPTFAHEMTNDCAAKAEKIANVAEREASIKACLAEVSSAKNVAKAEQHDKEEHCNTNAKNMKLEGKKKTEYLNHCYKENDFDPKNTPHPKDAK
jgi:Skp family chaperone for outer membrane proteins